jgi:3-dehydroquinate synthase
MGLIDAGIGVKTGVNFDYHKNRLGTYHAPLAAYLDRSFLKTLDDRHMSNGLAEILKIALVKDRTLFELMERNVENMIPARLQGRSNHDEIFCRAIQGMLEELEPNLWEDRLERLVDYGHSFSPSIEMKALPKLLHGEAVNIDMVFSLILSKQRGLLSQYDLERVLRVMRQLNLPISHELCTAEFMQEALDDTVKHRNGRQRLPLTIGIGECMFVNDVSREEIESAAIELHQLVAQV